MRKIGIIVIYFGTLPEYLEHFLISCSFNRQLDWFLFTDQQKPIHLSENVFYHYFDINNFNNIASEKLRFPIKITCGYKLCDFKPAYGLIFEDFLKDYEYWGYSDIDIIFGDFKIFFTDDVLKKYDIISTYENFLSGPFCLYKNNEITRNLFRICVNYQSILQNSNHFAFDENIRKTDSENFSFRKIKLFIFFFLKELLILKKYNYSLAQFRYSFQWYYKQKNIIWEYPTDMTEAVYTSIKNSTINASFNQLLYSDCYYKRINRKNWQIKWHLGTMSDMNIRKEIFAFHFPFSKNLENFKVDTYKFENVYFIISETGIKNG